MLSQQIAFGGDAESVNRLVRHVAGRDRAAFRRLHRRVVHRIFLQVRAALGDSALSVAVTRAVLVEVWRLAPASTGRHDDALGWLADITSRRVTDRRCSTGPESSTLTAVYDEHISLVLTAILARPHGSRSRSGTGAPARGVPRVPDSRVSR